MPIYGGKHFTGYPPMRERKTCAGEQRTDKRPQLSDLRDSGTIEQADPAARNAAAGRAEILVAKQRLAQV
jgi:replicative DNA helicase